MVDYIIMAYYRKSDWDRFIASIDDPEKMHDSWEDWEKAYNELKMRLLAEGRQVYDITIEIDELSAYCANKGLKNIGKTRAEYVRLYGGYFIK